MTITMPTSEQVQALLAPYLDASLPVGFAVGVVSAAEAPKGVCFYAGTVENQNGQPLTLGDTTLFEIASISKTFCATLYAKYFAANPALNDAKVTAYCPPGTAPLDSRFAGITLLSLANYTSGLPADPKDPHDQPSKMPSPYTVVDMYDYLAGPFKWAIGPSGTTYTYSNLGFSLLGESLPAVAGSSDGYAALLLAEVIQPLGLSASTMMFPFPAPLALPRGFNGEGQQVGPGSRSFPAYYGAGGLVSTPADLLTWMRFNMGLTGPANLSSLLTLTQQPLTDVVTKTQHSQLGLGWFLTNVPTKEGGLEIIWKDGGYPGFSSFMTLLPSTQPGTVASDAGVFVVTNKSAPVSGFAPSAFVAQSLLCSMVGQTYDPPPLSTIRIPDE
jgi:D-alanyl-D-alanine-carboxypeptidase/D-alanyl-D-alanine-endopeptidase